MRLYAVLGKTGMWEYQDTWVVKCFSDFKAATEFCNILDSVVLDYQSNKVFNKDMEYSQSLQEALSVYDPDVYLYDGYVSYRVEECSYTP